MRLTDIFKFKLYDRQDKADLEVVNENFQSAEAAIDKKADREAVETKIQEVEADVQAVESGLTKKLDKANVSNASNVTQVGYALDARQANSGVAGSLAAQIAAQNNGLVTHKTSGDHDGRYYTETEIDSKIGTLNTNIAAKQNTSTAINTGNISSQSVNYANSAGGVAWGNVSGKPATFTPSGHSHNDIYYTKTEVGNIVNGIGDYVGKSGSYGNGSWINGTEKSIESVADSLPIGATRIYLYLPTENDRNYGLMSSEWGRARIVHSGAYAEIEYTSLTSGKKFIKWKCDSWDSMWIPYSGYNTPRINGVISDVLLLSNCDGAKNNQEFLYNKNSSSGCPQGAEFGFRVVKMTSDVHHNGTLNAMVILYDMNGNIYTNTIQGGPWLGWIKHAGTPVGYM